MGNPVGSLRVDLEANFAKFQEDLGKATALAEANSRRISGAFKGVGAAAGALGIAFSFSAIKAWGEDVNRAAEELSNLSASTGSSVEALSQLKNVALVSGTSFETFRTAIERLAAGMAGGEEASTKTAKALEFLGITAADPATALTEIAIKLNTFADGANKAALARDLFGRGGVAFLSTLKTLAETQGVVATTTAQQAAKAQELAESYRKLALQSTALKDSFLNDVVPALATLVKDMSDATKIAGSFAGGLGLLANTFNPFISTAEGIAKTRDELDKLKASRVDVGKLFGPDPANLESNISKLEKTLALQKQMQVNALGLLDNPANYDARDIRAKTKPTLPYRSDSKIGGAVDDPTKKILDGYIKNLDASIEEEKSLLSTRTEVLGRYYQDNYVSIKDYFDTLATLRADNLTQTVAAYNAELAAIDRYVSERDKKGQFTHKETDRQDELNRGIEIRKKLALAEQQFGKETVLAALDSSKASKDYENQVTELSAALLELNGNTVEAFRIRQQLQNQSARDKFTANGDSRALDSLNALERGRLLQVQASKSAQDYSRILDQVGRAQARINLEVETGGLTTLESLAKTSDLNKSMIPILQQQYEEYLAIAVAANNPDMIAHAEEMKLKLEELAATGDLVAREFNGIFHDAFAQAFTDAITGTKSLKKAFTDMEKSIVASISRIASQNIADALFGAKGQGGSLSGLGDIFSKIFGGAGGKSGGGGGIFDWLSSLFGGGASGIAGSFTGPAFGFAANGSSFTSGGPYMVGERGPEIIVPARGSQVIPNNMLGSSNSSTYNITVNPPPGMSRQSAQQFAVQVGADLNRRMKRA